MLERISAKMNIAIWVTNILFAIMLLAVCLTYGSSRERGCTILGCISGITLGFFIGSYLMWQELHETNDRTLTKKEYREDE